LPWRVRFEKRALKEMARLGSVDQERIARFIRDRIEARDNPREVGEALAGPFAGYWKYRIGDYRIIASIDDDAVTIIVIRIGNRREIYR
jgi:mRNA interferase RelE/StbE